jgi:murein peptide amidase A
LLGVEIGDPLLPAVAIAAGVHGDEPAGPWALLELVESAMLDTRLRYRILPCTNPSGFDAQTRENAQGVDVNRSFGGNGRTPEARAALAFLRPQSFALSIDLHEDCDADGFYCYEYGGGEIGRAAIVALEAQGFTVDPLEVTFGLAGPLDDAHCVREWGRIVADAAREAGLLGGLSYSLALARNGARHALTFETPSSAPPDTRRAMHRTAVRAAIAALLEESASMPCN